jgi:hypothetical protein
MDAKIKKLQKGAQAEVKGLKSLLKDDKKQDKIVDKAKKKIRSKME